MIPTPFTPHLKAPSYSSVYPPAEDTYLLLDVLEEHLAHSTAPLISLEIGSGSGVVTTFIKTISPGSFCLAVDINPVAARATQETARFNNQDISVVCADLGAGLENIYGKVDLLVFNPPYVVTEPSEVSSGGIEASWAGGIDGREVIDKFLPNAEKFLSPTGVFFLLGIKQNKPQEISSSIVGLSGSIVAERKAGIERLWVIKFTRSNERQENHK